jgi:TetR/AcrR family transcriptional regulator, fatty acid metabolism regulator protein
MRSDSRSSGQSRGRTFTEEARRAQIVDSAIETIAELGFAGASLAEIDSRARISKGVIYYHFAGKDELIEQVFEHVSQGAQVFIAGRMEAAEGPLEQVKTYVEANLNYWRDNRAHIQALTEIVLSLRNPDGTLRYDPAGYEPLYGMLEEILRAGQREGTFETFDTRVMAVTIQAAIDYANGQWVAKPDLDFDAYTKEVVALLLRAMRPTGPRRKEKR